MPLFEINEHSFRELKETSFGSAGLKERADLQRLLRDQIEIVAEGVLLIAEEFSEWTESRLRIDLLGIDKDANLVVIELKRTDDGGHMELQALRYAALVSTLTADRATEIFGTYLQSRGHDDDPEQLILDFLEWTELDEDKFAQDVRMVLVSADFSRELTTAVIWLNEKDLDIRCLRIKPYSYNGQTLIDVQQVIPIPETADYQVQVREKKRQERASRRWDIDFTRYDVTINGETHTNQWKRNSILIVVKELVERGVSLLEIRALFREMGRGSVFLEIPGEVRDVQEFCTLATEQAASVGKKFNVKRWHTGDDDLIVFSGNTYAFTNQWGRRWPKFMKELKQRYPKIGLEYSPSQVI